MYLISAQIRRVVSFLLCSLLLFGCFAPSLSVTASVDRFECEDTVVLASDGKTPYNITRLSDPDASNKAVAGSTGGKYFVFKNVAESNCIHIAYASTNTNNMNLYIRFPWEADFHDAGIIPFSTSNSWNMNSSYIAVSPKVYIPEGSDIKIHPNMDINLDCLWLTVEEAGSAVDVPAGTMSAEALSDKAEKDMMAAQMEAFRTESTYVGLLFFCGLGSSFPSAQGVTSDILSPDVSTAESLQIRPYTKKLLKNAFSDLGIVIDEYTENVKRGDRLRLPIILVNDTGNAISDLPVTIKVMSGDTVIFAKRITMSVDAFSKDNKGLSEENVSLRVPDYSDYCQDGTTLTVTASYELDGETVYSQRKWLVNGGETSDGQPPEYDWLAKEESSETDTEASQTDATPDTDIVTDPSATTADTDSNGNSAVIIAVVSALAILTVAAIAVVIIFRKSKNQNKK